MVLVNLFGDAHAHAAENHDNKAGKTAAPQPSGGFCMLRNSSKGALLIT